MKENNVRFFFKENTLSILNFNYVHLPIAKKNHHLHLHKCSEFYQKKASFLEIFF